jgi:hypothetical protein
LGGSKVGVKAEVTVVVASARERTTHVVGWGILSGIEKATATAKATLMILWSSAVREASRAIDRPSSSDAFLTVAASE